MIHVLTVPTMKSSLDALKSIGRFTDDRTVRRAPSFVRIPEAAVLQSSAAERSLRRIPDRKLFRLKREIFAFGAGLIERTKLRIKSKEEFTPLFVNRMKRWMWIRPRHLCKSNSH